YRSRKAAISVFSSSFLSVALAAAWVRTANFVTRKWGASVISTGASFLARSLIGVALPAPLDGRRSAGIGAPGRIAPGVADTIAIFGPLAIATSLGVVLIGLGGLAAQVTLQQLLSHIRFARVFVRRAPGILQTANPRLPRVTSHALRITHFCITH